MCDADISKQTVMIPAVSRNAAANSDGRAADKKMSLPSSSQFFEPFTQTSYMVRQELVIDKLPSTGTFEIVVFDKTLRQDESGKYVLAVGEREDFSAVDYFTTLPAAWFETKVFFEDYASIVMAVAAIFGAIALLPIAIFRGKIREKLRTR